MLPCSLVELCRSCSSSWCLRHLRRWKCSQNSSTGSHTERSSSGTHLQTLFLQYRVISSYRRTNLPNDLSPSNVPIKFFLSFLVHHTCYTFHPYFLYLNIPQNDEVLHISALLKPCQEIHSSRYTDQLPSRRKTLIHCLRNSIQCIRSYPLYFLKKKKKLRSACHVDKKQLNVELDILTTK